MAADAENQETIEQETEAPAEQPDIGRLVESFNSFRDDISSRLDGLEQGLQWEPDDEQPEWPQQQPSQPWQPGPSDIDPNTGQLTHDAQLQQLRAFVQQEAQGLVQQYASTQQEQQLERDRNSYADNLEKRYPALRDPKVQEEMVQATVDFARSIGRPDLAGEPRLLEKLFLASQAQRSEQETPADAQVHLETGGSAAPSEPPEEDIGDRIVQAARKRAF